MDANHRLMNSIFAELKKTGYHKEVDRRISTLKYHTLISSSETGMVSEGGPP